MSTYCICNIKIKQAEALLYIQYICRVLHQTTFVSSWPWCAFWRTQCPCTEYKALRCFFTTLLDCHKMTFYSYLLTAARCVVWGNMLLWKKLLHSLFFFCTHQCSTLISLNKKVIRQQKGHKVIFLVHILGLLWARMPRTAKCTWWEWDPQTEQTKVQMFHLKGQSTQKWDICFLFDYVLLQFWAQFKNNCRYKGPS